MSDLAGDDGEPVTCNSAHPLLVLPEVLLDVDEVGVQGALVAGVYHPEYEQ